MNRGRWIGPVVVTLAIIGLLATGCSEDSSRPDPNGTVTEVPDLDDPLGGYTAQDEQPAFGDPDLAESGAAEIPYQDEMEEDPDITGWSDARPDSVRAYVVTLLWGQLDADPASTDDPGDDPEIPVTDWSGSAELSRGGLLLRSVIAFEQGDYIVRPRTDRTRIDWVSYTTVSFDGLRLLVYQPLDEENTGEDDELTIQAGTHEWIFQVNDLAELEFEEAVDDLGNKFSIRAFYVEPTVCSRGFLGGAWVLPDSVVDQGNFRGRWVSVNGLLAGYLRGHYGINSEGRKVFFGKYIALDGTFLGFLRGGWDRVGIEEGSSISPRHRVHGWFRGDWLDAEEVVVGRLRGHWRSRQGTGGGVFEGVWSSGCCNP